VLPTKLDSVNVAAAEPDWQKNPPPKAAALRVKSQRVQVRLPLTW
jgi:hypothetical protein